MSSHDVRLDHDESNQSFFSLPNADTPAEGLDFGSASLGSAADTNVAFSLPNADTPAEVLDFGSADMACADDTGAANVDHTTAAFNMGDHGQDSSCQGARPDDTNFANHFESNQSHFSLSTEDTPAEVLDFGSADMACADDTGAANVDHKTAGFNMDDHGQDSSCQGVRPDDTNFASSGGVALNFGGTSDADEDSNFAFNFDFAGTDDADDHVGHGIGVFSPSSRPKALTRTSSTIDGHDADGDAGYAADGDDDYYEQPALKKQRRTTRRNMPMHWRPLHREILTSYCVNNAPRGTCCEDEGGTALICEHDGCSNAAAVWCRTCEHTLCRECDVMAHSGQICNPVPHMRETVFTGVELGPKEAAPTEGGLADVIPNVYLVCSAVCQGCGLRNWTPSGDNRQVGLTVVTVSGRFTIDRTAYTCKTCGFEAAAGDPMTYLTKTTIPATLGDTQTIFSHDIVSFLHRLQRKAPGVSADAMAGALSSLGNTVRPEHVRAVLGLLEDIDAGLAASATGNSGSTGMDEYARAIGLQGVHRSVGMDMSQKVRLKTSITRIEKERELLSGVPEDNMGRPEVIPDHVAAGIRLLDPRQQTVADACDREFAATKATNNGDAREGLVVAVDASGSPVAAVIPLHGDGERYVYHLIALIAARFAGHFAYCSIDIACKFNSWLNRVGVKVRSVEEQLRLAASAARTATASLRNGLSSAAVAGHVAVDWLQLRLLAVAPLFKRKNMTDDDACREAAAVMTAMVYLLEVWAGIDVEITDPTKWPDFQPEGYVVVLDAMHSYAHGYHCRLMNDPRGPTDIGRQDGEQVERYNAIVLAYASRFASSGTEMGKQVVATSMRAEQDAKLMGAAATVRRAILNSRSLLSQLADELKYRSEQLQLTTSINAEDEERAAREALTLSAKKPANNHVGATGAEPAQTWAAALSTLTFAKTVEAGILARIANDREKNPKAKQLQALLARCMVAKTETELAGVVDAIERVTGEDSLAATTVRLAMQDVTKLVLPLTVPEFAGKSDGAVAIDSLKKDLKAIGMPDEILNAGFRAGGVKAIDSTTLCSWIAIRMSMDQAEKLAAAIRERKLLVYGPSGNNSGAHRAKGGAGSQRRALQYKCVSTRLKQRASQLWAWVRKYNALAKGLQDSVETWRSRHTRSTGYPALHLDAHNLPKEMSDANVRDPSWTPDASGRTAGSVIDIAFLDALRSYRTHSEEATDVGSANAQALLSVLEKTHSDIADRINDGLTPVLRAPHTKQAPGLSVALRSGDRLFARARHCPRSMLTPQVLLSGLTGQEVRASADTAVNPDNISDVHVRCLLAGWRAKLLQRLQHVSLLWRSARAILQDFIPVAQAAQAEPGAHTEMLTVLPGNPSAVDRMPERAPSSMSSSAPMEDAVQHGSGGAQAAPSSQLQVQLQTSGELSDHSSAGDASTSDGADGDSDDAS